MQDTPNPYAVQEHPVGPAASLQDFRRGQGRMVDQVTIVGILQIVEGALELLIGSSLIFLAFFLGTMMKMQAGQDAGAPPPEAMVGMMQAMYGGLGGVIASLAVLRIFSGIASFWFRGRLWTIVSLLAGLVSAFTCYCAPFSIGLCIYGLIVMFNPGVKRAYEMASQGTSAAEIKRHFAGAEYR